MPSASDFRKGIAIKFKNSVYIITQCEHIKPGKGQAFVRTKLKDLKTGLVTDATFRDSDQVEFAEVQKATMQYLYNTGDLYYFMRIDNYEQIPISENNIKDEILYLKENMNVIVTSIEGKPVSIELPNFVELEVVETEPGIKGDTVQGGSKPAKLETGAIIQVPLFINVGDVIKVDTRTGEYIERVY